MKYVRKIVNDYVVIDLETTGLSPFYDRIIEIGLLKVINNKIVDKFQTLIDPEFKIDEFITELTGITNEMLQGKPKIDEVKKDVMKFIGDNILLGHNTSFDISFLQSSFDEEYNNEYVDTLQLSRKVYPSLEHHRLKDMVSYLNLSNNEHRSISDCISTKELYDAIKKHLLDNNIKLEDLFYKKRQYIDTITSQVETFDEDNFFYKKHCVFTGVLEKMIRKDAMQLVVNVGGVLDKSVTKKTNYLILGNNDYCSSIKDGKSSKQKKAEKLKLKGQDIDIIDEYTFYQLINYKEEEKPENTDNVRTKNLSDLNDDEITALNIIKDILTNNNKDASMLRGFLLSDKTLSICLFGQLLKIRCRGKLRYITLPDEIEELKQFDLSSFKIENNRLYYSNVTDLSYLKDYILYSYDPIIKGNEEYIENVSVGEKNYKKYLNSGYMV